MHKEISDRQAMRYNRQILIPGFDIDSQEKLLGARVLQVGAGGLGCACAQFLVAAGIGALTIVDDDTVELTNLQRQVLHSEPAIGQLKVVSATESLNRLNSDCEITPVSERLDERGIAKLLHDISVIVDCSDNLATRNLLNKASLGKDIPLISGSAIRMEGQLCTFLPGEGTPCYACLSSMFGEQQLSCVESGIMSPVVGIIGSLQALEVIKVITGFGQPSAGKLQLYDGMSGQWHTFTIPKNPRCEACHS